MTDEARFFAGDVMAQHWSGEDGGVATRMATKKSSKKSTKKPKPKPTQRGPGCGTGKKTC
jgi:hypothetical protein